MYLKFYGLNEEPFHITPDPEFLYSSSSHKEALALMVEGVEQRKGFVVLTGEVGVGKTTIVRAFMEHCRQQGIKTVCVLNSRVTFAVLMKMVCEELGLESHSKEAADLVQCFYQFLAEECKQGRNVVLVMDEAQNMSINTLEDLGILFDLETSQDKLLQIILSGQSELERKLSLKELRQIQQRIGVRIKIAELSPDESLGYIRHRLAKAGMQFKETSIFTRAALRLIVKLSMGIPRKINIICDNALSLGFSLGKKPIPLKVVKDVIADLDGRPNRVSVRWIMSCTFLAALFLVLAGVAIVRMMGFTQTTDSKRSPSVAADHQGTVDRTAGLSSSDISPVPPDDKPVPPSIPGAAPVPDPQSTPVAPAVESLKPQRGMMTGNDSTPSSAGKIPENSEENGGKSDRSVMEKKAPLPASDGKASGKIAGPPDQAVQKEEKPVREEESSSQAGSSASIPKNAAEDDSPDPNKLMDWLMNRRGR